MFAYGERLNVASGLLVYPRIDARADVEGVFEATGCLLERRCGMVFVRLFGDDDRLRSDIGDDILDKLAL